MKKILSIAVIMAMASSTVTMAAPSGTFRQAHELGFGDKSSLDPIAK